MKNDINKKKVLVGVSGGVDSSVTVALLQKRGFGVEGVFLDFWRNEKSESGLKSAKKVAENLNIPLLRIDARKEFKKEIVDKFIEEYKKGNTPNPCVICNPQMKFKVLLREAKKRKADLVATGHYARLFAKKNGEMILSRAKDKKKDQSYFLYGLKQEQLSRIIFPLGDYLKGEIRELAEKFGLPTAKRAESQDVCFVAENKFGDFLQKHIKNKPGKIADENDNVLGEHFGLHFYTIGQRKGINIGGDGPYYVVGKNAQKNTLIISADENKLYKKDFVVKNANLLFTELKLPLEVKIKVRYHSKFIYGIIEPKNDSKDVFTVKLSKPQKAITPGQSAVFYTENEEVVGGGIIV